MHKICYKRNNKYGLTTIFMAIVLTAVIFVESVYLFSVISSERRATMMKALKSEVSVILSDYNQQLFDTYGIYAFDNDEINSEVFDEVLETKGISGSEFNIDDYGTLSVEDLKKAVSAYYSNRGFGVIFNQFSDVIFEALEKFDNNGLLGKIGEFMSSSAGGILSDVLDGSDTVTKITEKSEEIFGDEADEKLEEFNDFLGNVKYESNAKPEIKDDINPKNFSGIYSVLDGLYKLKEQESTIVADYIIHPALMHYGTYNFDCKMSNEDDFSLDGTKFKDIHSGNFLDIEYIATGIRNDNNNVAVNGFIYGLCLLSDILVNRMDEAKMTQIRSIATTFEAIVAALTAGVGVAVPYIVYETAILIIYSLTDAYKHYKEVMDGGSVKLFELKSVPVLSAGIIDFSYREFVLLMMTFVSDDVICNRIIEVLRRDYGELGTIVTLGTKFRGKSIAYTEGYVLYE